VFASDVDGESGYATTTATAIGAPTGLSVVAVSGHEIYLEWEDNSDIEWGFWIEASLDGADGWFVVDWAGEDAHDITLAGPFDPSTAYYFRVAAYSGWDVSAYSAVASDTTAAFPAYPTELLATTVSTTRIDLAWVDNADDELGYTLQRSLDGESWSDVPIIDHESANDTGVLAGNVYQYRVFAYNAAGESGYSTAQAATVPGAPANLTATPLDAWRIELDWDDPSGNSPVFYSVFAGTSPGFTPGPESLLVSELWSSEWTVEELEPLTSYYFKVMATDLYDQTSAASAADATTTDVPPSAPGTLEAQATGPNAIDLSWPQLSSNHSGFVIEHSTNALDFAAIQIDPPLSPSATGYTVDGLADGTKHYFRLKAINAGGGSAWSDVASDITPLAPPTDFEVSGTTHNTITLTWTDNSVNERGYEIVAVNYPYQPTMYAGANQTSFTYVVPDASWEYDFSIRAFNSTGFSAPATRGDVQTSELPPPAEPQLSVEYASATTVDLSWGSDFLVSSYQMQWDTDDDFEEGIAGWQDFDGGVNGFSLVVGGTSSRVWYFRLRARNHTADVWSAVLGPVNLPAADPSYPNRRIDLDAVSSGDDRVKDGTENLGAGTWIARDDEDFDRDGVPDFADGYASGGTGGNAGPDAAANFTPLHVMPIGFSFGDTITFWYDGSDPADVDISGDPQRGYVYTPGAGGLRIWTRNGGWGYVDEYEVAHGRDSRGLEDGGDYVTPGYAYTIADFAAFADEYGRITLYVEGVNGSEELGDYTVSVVAEHGTYTYVDALRFTVVGAELTAYRAGSRFGEAIPDSIEGMGEANLFYVQINNDAEERLDGYNIDGGNDRAVIPPVREGGPWSGDDDDLVRIRLHQLKVVPASGQVRIEFLPEEGQRPWVSNPVRIFDAEGNQLYFDGYEVGPPGYGVTVNTYELLTMDLANPQGPLAGLLSGDVDLWLEGVEATTHFGIQLLIATSGATDQVHMGLPDWRPELVTVAFTDGEGLDGIPMKDYYDDQNGNNECDPGESLGDTSITGPEYVRDTGRNKYALVQAGTRFHVQSRFKLDVPPELLEDPVMAWALADNSNFDLSPVELIQESPGSDYWSGLFQVEVAPDAIDVLDITWEWHIVMSDLELSERSQHTVLVCLAAPSTFPATSTSESPDATLAKWASESAAGQTGDTNILNALISRTNLEKIGAYTLPPRYPANHPWAHLERDTYEPLVAFKRGSCGHWADLFQVAANLEAVEVVKNGFITLRLPIGPT
jgi:hypothetical protein